MSTSESLQSYDRRPAKGDSDAHSPSLNLNLYAGEALVFLVLGIINLTCFWQSLSCYFYADDLERLAYIYRAFHGHPEGLLQNFYSCWGQDRSFQLFYRPFIELTLSLDYFFWKANPFGYHLSNLSYQIISSEMLFLLTRRLLKPFDKGFAAITAFFTAALFAAFPLHCEVVTWIIGRVDGLCTAFFLLSFWCFLKAKQDNVAWAKPLSLIAFVLSLLSKEMGACLPLTLTWLCLWQRPTDSSWQRRLANSLQDTWMYWSLLFVYLLIRALSLGSFWGGYTGAYGEICNTSFIERWFGFGSLWVVVNPFNKELFSPNHWLRTVLHLLYFLTGIIILVRQATKNWSTLTTQYVVFSIGWIVITLAPTAQVFNLAPSLLGSRFTYLASAPLCLLLSLLILPLAPADSKRKRHWLQNPASILLAGFVICFAIITPLNNSVWFNASKEIHGLQSSIQAAVRQLAPGKRLAIIDVPQNQKGAHLIYDYKMLQSLVIPPLLEQDLSAKLFVLEPLFIGNEDLLNVSQLRRMVHDPSFVFAFWDSQKHNLVSWSPSLLGQMSEMRNPLALNFSPIKTDSSMTKDYVLARPPVSILHQADMLEVDLHSTLTTKQDHTAAGELALTWQPSLKSGIEEEAITQPLIADGKVHRYIFPVSQYKSWVLYNPVPRLHIKTSGASGSTTLLAAQLTSGLAYLPQVWADSESLTLTPDGTYDLIGNQARLHYDASKIPYVKSVAVEISRPFVLYKLYKSTYRDTTLSAHSLRVFRLDKPQGSFILSSRDFKDSSWYQIRIAALANNGQVIGYVSDPITVKIDSKLIQPSNSPPGLQS